jgi:hypothetical protein
VRWAVARAAASFWLVASSAASLASSSAFIQASEESTPAATRSNGAAVDVGGSFVNFRSARWEKFLPVFARRRPNDGRTSERFVTKSSAARGLVGGVHHEAFLDALHRPAYHRGGRPGVPTPG